jgi:hypothetical protein
VPSERLDIARRGIDAYNSGDFQAVFELLDEEIEAVVPDGMANAGTYYGHEGFRRMTKDWGEAGGRGSGVETQMHAVHLMRFRRGRMYRWRLCETLDEAERHAHDP